MLGMFYSAAQAVSFLFYFSLFSPNGAGLAVMCSDILLAGSKCPCAAAAQHHQRGAQGHPGCSAAFSVLEKEGAHGENVFEMHLDLKMSHFGAGSCRVYGSASGQ